MLQKIIENTPSVILALYQRRLIDKNAVITTEEFIEATAEIDLRIKLNQIHMESIISQQEILKKMIQGKEV